MVQLLTDRLEGKVAFRDDGLSAGERRAPWADVLVLVRDPADKCILPPQTILMTSGERWGVELLGGTSRQIRVRSSLFGERQIDANLVCAVFFSPAASGRNKGGMSGGVDRPTDANASATRRTAYRNDGEAVPGDLLAVNEDRITLNSPLGVLGLPREGISRYVFNNPGPAEEAKEDEVRIIDGSSFRGKATPNKGGLQLDHAVLGRLQVPCEAVRSVVRHPPSVIYITNPPKDAVKTLPLLGNGRSGQSAISSSGVSRDLGESAGEIGDCPHFPCARAIVLCPRTEIRYRLPDRKDGKWRFRASLGYIDDPYGQGARGAVNVRISAGGRVLLESRETPGTKPAALSLELAPGDRPAGPPAGEELVIEVDFAGRIAFPAGVVLGDPHIVMNRESRIANRELSVERDVGQR